MHGDLARVFARPIAHRGLHGGGRAGPVENSLGAARAAIAADYGIECDVRLSRDGEAMVFHDADLARLTGAVGPVAEHHTEALQALPLLGGGGDHVPTLAELLATIDGRIPLVIEMKADAGGTRLADRVLNLVAAYDGALALESFDPALVMRCRRRGTSRPLGLVGPAEDGTACDAGVMADCDFLSWSIADLDAVAAAFPTKPLTTWTVRTPAQARNAAQHGAQIVFEGFDPSQGINSAKKVPPRLNL